MSSATSTDTVRLQADRDQDPRRQTDRNPGLQPWQFFVLAALACATVVTFISRGQGVTTVILLSVLMLATVAVGLAVLRTVRPLVIAHEDRTAMVGERTRAALEREKALALRALKELEFDRRMGKLSEEDFREMSTRLRARATRLIKQLDAGAGYRARIEADLAKRLGEKDGEKAAAQPSARACAACSTSNDSDARFCKKCGNKLY